MHGVLMHNDEAEGDDHKVEDQYLRFKDVLKTENPQYGPGDAEKEYHGVLMHGDGETGHEHEETPEMLPEFKANAGPQDLNEAMHEMMHGDEGAKKHEWEQDNVAGVKSPPDAEQLMHGMLMHGDATHGEHHDTGEPEVANTQPAGPQDAEGYMHGVLMHGDNQAGVHHEHHDTADAEVANTKPVGPQDAEQYMHGVLMHGDNQPGHHHGHHAEEEAAPAESPDAASNLHGILTDNNRVAGHDHSGEHDVGEAFSDIAKILSMELGEDLLKIIDIKNILDRDQAEYDEYLKAQHQDESLMGSTYASVPDTILSDIDLLKRRYIDKLEEDGEVYDKAVQDDDTPFTAEDAAANIDATSDPHEHEDARHNLELVGSTDPINFRHRVYKELKEAQAKKHP